MPAHATNPRTGSLIAHTDADGSGHNTGKLSFRDDSTDFHSVPPPKYTHAAIKVRSGIYQRDRAAYIRDFEYVYGVKSGRLAQNMKR